MQQSDMREGLWKVAQQASAHGVIFFAEKADIILKGHKLLKIALRLLNASASAKALTNQNEQIRNAPSLPANPSTPSSVE